MVKNRCQEKSLFWGKVVEGPKKIKIKSRSQNLNGIYEKKLEYFDELVFGHLEGHDRDFRYSTLIRTFLYVTG